MFQKHNLAGQDKQVDLYQIAKEGDRSLIERYYAAEVAELRETVRRRQESRRDLAAPLPANRAENGSEVSDIRFCPTRDGKSTGTKADTWLDLSLTDAFAAMQTGRTEHLFLYLRLRQAGIEGDQWFTLADLGWHNREGKRLARLCTWRRGAHGRYEYRLPSQHQMSRYCRGGSYDGKTARRVSIRNWGRGMVKLGAWHLLNAKAFRKRLLLEYLRANPGKHFLAMLGKLFRVCRKTVARDIRELPVRIHGNYIELNIACKDDWRQLKAAGASWFIIEARRGQDIVRRLLRSVSGGFIGFYLQCGYDIVCRIRTANSYYLEE